MNDQRPEAKGRGAYVSPPNRFGQVHAEDDLEHVEHDEEYLNDLRNLKTQYLPDESRSIVSKNDSPDLNFNYSLNPYVAVQFFNLKLVQTQRREFDISRGWAQKLRQARVTATR
jgi:hypothetical protein